eukprot:6172710-Pleurochrysis_carterae.AAC.3
MHRTGESVGQSSDSGPVEHISSSPSICPVDNALPSAPSLTGPKWVKRGPQDVACQTDSSLLELPPRPEKKIYLHQECGAGEVERRANELDMSVIPQETARAEILDHIQDSLRKRTQLGSSSRSDQPGARATRSARGHAIRRRCLGARWTWRAQQSTQWEPGKASNPAIQPLHSHGGCLDDDASRLAIVSSVKSTRGYFSYMYALVDKDGEVTPSQDEERRELSMKPSDFARLLAVALDNVRRMA